MNARPLTVFLNFVSFRIGFLLFYCFFDDVAVVLFDVFCKSLFFFIYIFEIDLINFRNKLCNDIVKKFTDFPIR